MRKLTNDELWRLESVLDDGILFLFLREEGEEESIRYLKMKFPNKIQDRAAKLEEFKYKSLIGQEPGIKSRRTLEKEHKAELKEINNEMRDERRRLERLRREFTENDLPSITSAEEDPEAFEAELSAKTETLQNAVDAFEVLEASRREILTFCSEELAMQHYIERITQICWEFNTHEKDADGIDIWQLQWNTWEEFENDHNPLVQKLTENTRLWLMSSVPFFGSLPSQPVGGSDT